jgi:tRNA pseudouridine13 synthase
MLITVAYDAGHGQESKQKTTSFSGFRTAHCLQYSSCLRRIIVAVSLNPPPLLTAELPGIGGRIKSMPEDFEVEEIPAYSPSGQGDFLYLWIEKRDMGAQYFTRQVAQRLGIPVGEVGSAGLKDRRAVTRQMISVPASVESRLNTVDGEGIRVLTVDRHSNKLRPGHLHGNRFRILIRGVEAATDRLPPIMVRLHQMGLPNFYGPQRFGKDGETAQMGLALLRGERVKVRNPFLRKLALSAAQSVLFNACLARRMSDGLFRTVLSGDVMAKWPFGGMFVAEDVSAEQGRFEAREIVHAGPMFGRKTFAAKADAAAREAEVLREAGLTQQSLQGFGKLLQGTRRHNLIYLNDLTATVESEGMRISVTLPAGSYATVLLREITKSDHLDNDDDAGSAADGEG